MTASHENYEQTFQVGEDARLRVQNIRGSIEIKPGDDGVIEVKAVKYLDNFHPEDTLVTIEQSPDGEVVASAETPRDSTFWHSIRPCRVEFVITAPKNCVIHSKAISASTAVEGFHGELHFKSVSGAVNLQDLSGSLAVGNVSGKIYGQGLSGPADVSSVSGKIDLAGCDFPRLDCSTVSGRMSVETPLGDGPYRFKSVSGSAMLIVPEETACSVQTRSLSGRFTTSLRATRVSSGKRNWDADLNGGGSAVFMNSVSGNLKIVDGTDQIARTPQVPRVTHQERLDILNQVAGGDLSVEDAVTRLAA